MPTLLAFIPHPDDESYSFGGTIALAAKAGWDCFIECASFGEKGKRHDGGSTLPNDVAAAREGELRESCRVLGAKEPRFWGLPDGQLTLHRGEARRITAIVRERRPDLVFTLGADGAYGHPDHTALYRWVFDSWLALPAEGRPALLFAVFPKGLFLPQWEKCRHMLGEPPHPSADEIGSERWNYEVPIGPVNNEKLAAVAAHRSQLPGGEPQALFPPGILSALLGAERFRDASGRRSPRVTEMVASFSARSIAP